MLDGILGRGFASKCKSLIKMIKSRIEVIRRKKSATLKFLKKDVADLLANGLDINAYGRVEGYIVELMLSACYDFVENCCDFVSKHVSVMQKLSNCPEDCREAVASLMFAAARFSDLPELRDLRQIFYERYGNSVELFVNKQLVENSASNPSTMEKKVKVMNDIASEHSIKWDSEAFERRMSKNTVLPKEPKNHGSFHVNGGDQKSNDGRSADPQEDKLKFSSKEKLEVGKGARRRDDYNEDNVSKRDEIMFPPNQEFSVDKYRHYHGKEEAFTRKEDFDVRLRQKQEVSAGKLELLNGKNDVALKTARLSSSSRGRRSERVDDGAKLQDGWGNDVPRIDKQDILPERKPDLDRDNHEAPRLKSRDRDLFSPDVYAGQHSVQNLTRKTHDEDEPKLKPPYSSGLPPPYVKPNTKQKDHTHGANIGSSIAGFDSKGVSVDPSIPDRAYAVNRADKYQEGLHHPDKAGHIIPPGRVNSHDLDKDYYYNHDGSDASIPRRRSSRRRHSKPAPDHTEASNAEDTEFARRKPRSRRRDDSRRGLQILFDDEQHKDDEERIIDKLLIHYSKKPSSSDEGKIGRKSKSRHAHHLGSDAGEAPRIPSRDRSDDTPERISVPPRSISLPREQTAQSEGTKKVYARATSLQQDRSNAARHVHPKLPDYEDLAAHFAAMKGK